MLSPSQHVWRVRTEELEWKSELGKQLERERERERGFAAPDPMRISFTSSNDRSSNDWSSNDWSSLTWTYIVALKSVRVCVVSKEANLLEHSAKFKSASPSPARCQLIFEFPVKTTQSESRFRNTFFVFEILKLVWFFCVWKKSAKAFERLYQR